MKPKQKIIKCEHCKTGDVTLTVTLLDSGFKINATNCTNCNKEFDIDKYVQNFVDCLNNIKQK